MQFPYPCEITKRYISQSLTVWICLVVPLSSSIFYLYLGTGNTLGPLSSAEAPSRQTDHAMSWGLQDYFSLHNLLLLCCQFGDWHDERKTYALIWTHQLPQHHLKIWDCTTVDLTMCNHQNQCRTLLLSVAGWCAIGIHQILRFAGINHFVLEIESGWCGRCVARIGIHQASNAMIQPGRKHGPRRAPQEQDRVRAAENRNWHRLWWRCRPRFIILYSYR